MSAQNGLGTLLRRRAGLVVLAVAIVLFLSSARIAGFLTDWWWFDAAGFRSVFTTILGTQVLIGVVFGLILAVLVAVNLWIARRIRPLFIPATPQQAAVERYRQMADPYLPWLILAIALVFALTAGFAVASQWETFLLWRNAQSFGIDDPQFGRDVGFYLFSLPWWKFVQTWLFTSLLLVTLLTAGAHYLLGGIRPENPGEKVMPSVKVHLSVLLALVLAARGWGYWLDRFLLNFSPRGQVTGASYTDVNAELPALNLLLVVTAVAIGLVLYNIRRQGFLLPGAAIGLLVLASIILQGAYPAIIQRLRVEPQELQREDEFIARNLEATREAFGLEDIELQQFNIANDLTQQQVQDNDITLTNVRLWTTETLQTTYAQLQALRPYYEFNDVDVDRYLVDGELRQVMLSTRELDTTELPAQAQTWQNERLTYTHGYGMVASQVNTANAQGQPVFLSRDIPPRGQEELVPDRRSSIYYGEDNPDYSLVSTEADELNYEEPGTNRQVFRDYDGDGGVGIGSIFRRAMFALRFADTNLLLSNLLTDDSRVLFERDISARVERVAPYLDLDGDPYPVIIDGRVRWIQDAYTSSAFYPYSERVPWAVGGATVAQRTVNYVRNSVKAVVDAYDGTVTLYVVNPDDPMIQAWRAAFPDAYADVDEAPDGLVQHFRYPEELFELQSQVYATYHIPEAPAFYSKADAWDIPRDASLAANRTDLSPDQAPPMRPFYLLMKLPGEAEEEFVLIQPYLARNRPNMIAWLAGRSDPEHYGELFAVQFPSDQSVLGPQQAQARIEQDDEISEFITLRDQRGSRVIRGDLLVLPVEESIVYVEPLFIENAQAQIPELSRVAVVMGDRVTFERTLAEALAELVGAEAPQEGASPDGGGGEPAPDDGQEQDETADQLLNRALQSFAEAQQALEAGNLGEYQDLVEEAQQLIRRAAEIEGVEPPSEAIDGPLPQSEESPPEEVGGAGPAGGAPGDEGTGTGDG